MKFYIIIINSQFCKTAIDKILDAKEITGAIYSNLYIPYIYIAK